METFSLHLGMLWELRFNVKLKNAGLAEEPWRLRQSNFATCSTAVQTNRTIGLHHMQQSHSRLRATGGRMWRDPAKRIEDCNAKTRELESTVLSFILTICDGHIPVAVCLSERPPQQAPDVRPALRTRVSHTLGFCL